MMRNQSFPSGTPPPVDDMYLQDPSTRNLDKWRSVFHMFNMITLTVALISLGVSIVTYTDADAITSSVREYKAPLVYYGVNAVFMTGHTVFGALSCVKGKLLFLKIYTAVGLVLVLEELGIGSWMLATLSERIDAVISMINELEDDHESNHDHRRKKRSDRTRQPSLVQLSLRNDVLNCTNKLKKRSEDEDHDNHVEDDSDNTPKEEDHHEEEEGHHEEEEEHHDEEEEEHQEEEHGHDEQQGNDEEEPTHSVYKGINEYFGCCMYAKQWLNESQPIEEVYDHCLTDDEQFCGVRFILFPGGDKARENIQKNCDCEEKVEAVITERIVEQTALLFIALPSQVLCLIAVAFFIKFEITVENNREALSLYTSNVIMRSEKTSSDMKKSKEIKIST